MRAVVVPILLALATGAAAEPSPPSEVTRQLPPGYEILQVESGDLNGDGVDDYLVALAKVDEAAVYKRQQRAPRRPLLLFASRPGGGYVLAGRNDEVVANLDSDWQCDPFTSTYDGLVIKGRYFTVENGAACGTHWTDFITFRYDPLKQRFLFWKEISQNWKFGNDPEGEALVLDGDHVTKADPRKPVMFGDYRAGR
ncbi:MAG: hypothetical protein WA840_03905 [Caulobacteraceae bacterium]